MTNAGTRVRAATGTVRGMEVRKSVSRRNCFYGGAFPRTGETSMSGDFLPKQIGEEREASRCVSFDCDSLSEELGERKREVIKVEAEEKALLILSFGKRRRWELGRDFQHLPSAKVSAFRVKEARKH